MNRLPRNYEALVAASINLLINKVHLLEDVSTQRHLRQWNDLV